MALFEEKKSESNGIFEQNDLNKLTPNKGDSIGFYLHGTDERSGEDGKFMIMNGLQLDLDAPSIEKMVETAMPINFIPRLVLENKHNDGNFNIGEAYRLEKSINRGDEYKGKKVRYYAWDLYKVNAPSDILTQLKDKILTLQGKKTVLGSETAVDDTPNKPKM